jgi:hypothetical protein
MGILKTKTIKAGGGIGARFCGNVVPPRAPFCAAGPPPAQRNQTPLANFGSDFFVEAIHIRRKSPPLITQNQTQ